MTSPGFCQCCPECQNSRPLDPGVRIYDKSVTTDDPRVVYIVDPDLISECVASIRIVGSNDQSPHGYIAYLRCGIREFFERGRSSVIPICLIQSVSFYSARSNQLQAIHGLSITAPIISLQSRMLEGRDPRISRVSLLRHGLSRFTPVEITALEAFAGFRIRRVL